MNEISVISDLADKYGMTREAFEAALKATVFPSTATQAQFAAFCMVAKQYNLNPLLKEIYAYPSRGGGIVPIVSVDGWCNIINSNPACDGIQFEDTLKEDKLFAVTCKISRKDRKHPIECTEYMEECNKNTDTWKKWPSRMLRHKALIQCARYAFSLSGIYDEDEARRMDEPVIVDDNYISTEQAITIDLAIKDSGIDRDKLLKWAKAETSRDILSKNYEKVMKVIEERKGVKNVEA
jgi:phage recombination protein Bet